MTIIVSKHERPIVDVPVYFNGERVGTTGIAGTVTGTVPYVSTFTITTGNQTTTFAARTLPSGIPPGPQSHQVYAIQDGLQATPADVSFTLPTNVTVTATGPTIPGTRTTLHVAVNETPLRHVTVRLANTTVGTTNGAGALRTRIPLALTGRDSVPVTVHRGTYTGHGTLSLDTLTLNVTSGLPISLPFTNATATATTADGDNLTATFRIVAGAPPTGQTVARQTAHQFTFAYPLANTVTVIASIGKATATTTVSGLYLHAAGLLVAIFVPVIILTRFLWQHASGHTDGILETLVDLAVGAAEILSALTDRVAAALRRLHYALLIDPPSLDTLLSLAVLRRRIQALRSWLQTLLASLRDRVSQQTDDAKAPTQSNAASATADADSHSASSYERLRAIWDWFVTVTISRRRWRHLTVAEIAAKGQQMGLPASPVTRLRDAVRAVEYGGREADTAIDTADSAARDIARDDDDLEEPNP